MSKSEKYQRRGGKKATFREEVGLPKGRKPFVMQTVKISKKYL